MKNNVIEVSLYTKPGLYFCNAYLRKLEPGYKPKASYHYLSLYKIHVNVLSHKKKLDDASFDLLVDKCIELTNIANVEIFSYKNEYGYLADENISHKPSYPFSIMRTKVNEELIKSIIIFDYIYMGLIEAKNKKLITTKEKKIGLSKGLKIIRTSQSKIYNFVKDFKNE